MCKVNVYCDESGNSGDNYVDVGQPFFVLGAWAMPYERLADIAASIEACRKTYAPQTIELKSRSMLRTLRNRNALANLFEELGGMECLPMFLISEKRFFIAGKIIETFADPATNPLLNDAFTGDSTSKVELANSLYQLPNEVLHRFAAIYRRPTKKDFEACLDEITTAVASTVNKEIAALLNGCRDELDEIVELEASDELLGTARATLNLPAFVSMLMLIEQLARQGFIKPQTLIHDEQSAYGPVFEKIHNLHINAKEGRIIYPNGAEVLLPIKNIAMFGMESSKTSVFLQAADLLAGAIAYIAKAFLLKRELDPSEKRLAELTIPSLWLDKPPRLAWSVASSGWMEEALRRCLPQKSESEKFDVSHAIKAAALADPAPLPVLPTTGSGSDDPNPSFRFPTHPVGILRKKDGHLMLVRALPPDEAPRETAALLFSSTEAAQRALDWFSHNGGIPELYEIVEFDGEGFLELGNLLRQAMDYTELLLIDYKNGQHDVCNLESAATGYNRIVERGTRAAMSGPLSVIFQTHSHNGHAINTILSGDGSYTAVIVERDRFFIGQSRESALAAAKTFLDSLQ